MSFHPSFTNPLICWPFQGATGYASLCRAVAHGLIVGAPCGHQTEWVPSPGRRHIPHVRNGLKTPAAGANHRGFQLSAFTAGPERGGDV